MESNDDKARGSHHKISIAVAALAVHVPAEDWGDGGIVKWLRDEMNSHPEFIPGFLELLMVLPEV
ncbi:Transportin MOS14 [Vitis vinifera]|uniref:Transportin MOS14 n=1 Tax=Vitis vinifera TaxID=29760 RepID=A0A438EYD5_VITVI|nr:Transportin MOS14 [Vitis vinifera]